MKEDVKPVFIQNKAVNDALKNVLQPDVAEAEFNRLRAQDHVSIDPVVQAALLNIITLNVVTTQLAVAFRDKAKQLKPQTPDEAAANARILIELGGMREDVLRNVEKARSIVLKHSEAPGGFEFESWQAWKRLKDTATLVTMYYSNIEAKIGDQSSEQALETANIEVQLARAARLQHFIEDADRAEVRLREVLDGISTLGVKSKALQQDAVAWQERINQAERVVQRLTQPIPGSALVEGGRDLTIDEILGSVDSLAVKFKAAEGELTSLKSDWTSLEKQAKDAEKSLRSALAIQERLKPTNLAEQQKKIDDGLEALKSVEASARTFSTRVAIVKKKTDDAEKDVTKATASLATMTATESSIAQAISQVEYYLSRVIPGFTERGVPVTLERVRELATHYKEKAAQFRPVMDQLKDDWEAIEKDAKANEKIAAKVATQMLRFNEAYFADQSAVYETTKASFLSLSLKFVGLDMEADDVEKALKTVQKTIDRVATIERDVDAAQERLNASADKRRSNFEALREKQKTLDADLRTESSRRAEVQTSLATHDDKVRALERETTRQRDNLRLAKQELDAIERTNTALDKDYTAAQSRVAKVDDGARTLQRKAERVTTLQAAATAKIEALDVISDNDLRRATSKSAGIEQRAAEIGKLVTRAKETHTQAQRDEVALTLVETQIKDAEARAKQVDRRITANVAKISAYLGKSAQMPKQLEGILTQLEKIVPLLDQYLVALRGIAPGAAAAAVAAGLPQLPIQPPLGGKMPATSGSAAVAAQPGFPPIFGGSVTTVGDVTVAGVTATTSKGMAVDDEQTRNVLKLLEGEVEVLGGYGKVQREAEKLLVNFANIVDLLRPPPAAAVATGAVSATSGQQRFSEVVPRLIVDAEQFEQMFRQIDRLQQAIASTTIGIQSLRASVDATQLEASEARRDIQPYLGDKGLAQVAIDSATALKAQVAGLTDRVRKAIVTDASASGGEVTIGARIESLETDVATLTSSVVRLSAQSASADGMLAALSAETDVVVEKERAQRAQLAVLVESSEQLKIALRERRQALLDVNAALVTVEPDESVAVKLPVEEFKTLLGELDRYKRGVVALALKSGWKLSDEQQAAINAPIDYGFEALEEARARIKAAEAATLQQLRDAAVAAGASRIETIAKEVDAAELVRMAKTEQLFKTEFADRMVASNNDEKAALVYLRTKYERIVAGENEKPEADRNHYYYAVLAKIVRRISENLKQKTPSEEQQGREKKAKLMSTTGPVSSTTTTPIQKTTSTTSATSSTTTVQFKPTTTTVTSSTAPVQFKPKTTTVTSSTAATSATSSTSSRTTKLSGRGRRLSEDDDDGGVTKGPIEDRQFTPIEMLMTDARREKIMVAWRRLKKAERELETGKKRKIIDPEAAKIEAEELKQAEDELKMAEDDGRKEVDPAAAAAAAAAEAAANPPAVQKTVANDDEEIF